ncbi:MAG: Stk1 family PASTA domain-containing Ser/Thr kinase [Clostridia bacterium]|nr:Stk1 family PASTA domain-containing Ser/Thr kinase [Clostridia bacterium]
MIGTILSERYEVSEIIGSGGMAIVYKAKDRLLDRYVAVKMLREELQDDKDFVERFKAEARSAASLNHPNIVSVFDVGTEGNREYFVMEYIEGITLKEIIDKRQLSWKTACSYGVQIAGAIEHAHRKNIVHRDIKPHNIMITKDNVVKVTDFGIARAVTSSTIVRAGNVIGSVHYFSPEQASGGVVDFKSDIYSMGVVLYEMLTGRVPFEAENPVAIAKMHVDDQPQPPIELNGEIPETVNDIVLKAISKQPSKRYQRSEDFAADLKKVITDPDSINVKDDDATQFVPVVKPAGTGYTAEKQEQIIIKGAEEEDEGRKTASKAAWVVATLVFLVSVFVIVAAFKPALFGLGERVEIPSLLGKTFDEAHAICEENGFALESEIGDYSEEYLEGQIMEQTPSAGMHKKVETIKVMLSQGLTKFTLDDYTGEDVNIVKNKLRSLGVDVVIEETQHDTMPVDTVVRHSPSKGSTLKAGSTVTLYVSSGVEDTRVPLITGITLERAQAALEAVGLKLGNVTEFVDPEMAGKVISQTILEGTEVKSGTEVDVTVGKMREHSNYNPNSEIVTYPDATHVPQTDGMSR